MKAVVVKEGQLAVLENYPIPQPQPHEVLVRVTFAGICSTDQEILRGYVPDFHGVLGHEFCGIVEKAPSTSTEWIGQRVCGSINIITPEQDAAYPGCSLEHHPLRTVLGIISKDGCFAEYLTIPTTNLVKIPNNVTDEEAVFTEPLAAALRIREQVCIQPSVKVAVLGTGKLGMLIGRVMQAAGTDVHMKCRSEHSFELPQKWGLAVGLLSKTESDSYPFVVEATGNVKGFQEALRIVQPMGTIILKSTFAADTALDLTKVVVAEIKIQGSRCGPFHAAMRILERKEIPVTDLITQIYPITKAEKALAHAQSKGTLKILLKM